jgi:hypothetical protein
MRRPAHTRRLVSAAPGWSHPYTGLPGIAVFYNDGGTGNQPPAPSAPPAAPSPADLAAQLAQQPPAAPAPAGQQPLIDRETGVAMTQERFNKIMTRQYEKSRDAAFRELAEGLGLSYDPKTFDPEAFKNALKEGQDARQQLLTDEQKRSADLEAREQAIAAREAATRQAEAAAAARDRDTRIRAALVSLGATGDDLEDATRLITVADDADDTQIRQAAQELKDRRSVLFGGPAAPQTLPPAPSGAPASGNQPHQPVPGSRDTIKEAARQRAIDMGFRRDDTAA